MWTPEPLGPMCLPVCPLPLTLVVGTWGQGGASWGGARGKAGKSAASPRDMCLGFSRWGRWTWRRAKPAGAPQWGGLCGPGSNPGPVNQRRPHAPPCLSFPSHLVEHTCSSYLQPVCLSPVATSPQQKPFLLTPGPQKINL